MFDCLRKVRTYDPKKKLKVNASAKSQQKVELLSRLDYVENENVWMALFRLF